MIREIELEVLTPQRLLRREEGEQVLSLLTKASPSLVPDKWGHYEPIRSPFDADDLSAILDDWRSPFLWKRRKPKAEGTVWLSWSPRSRHGWITMRADAAKAGVGRMVEFLQDASSDFRAHFGFMHLLVEKELSFGRQNNTVGCLDPRRQRYSLSVTGHKLARNVPELYWATVFGEPYVELFGLDRLLSVPAPVVREIGGGCVYIQLSESIYDLETDYERVDATRQAVKKHLDSNAFFDPDAPEGHVYNVPKLELELLPDRPSG